MVGISDLIWAYQNSGPALLLAMLAGAGYVYRHDILPRLNSLERTQERRDDKWQDQELNAQERALLIDDAHSRADQLEETMQRLKERVRDIEQSYAVDHGTIPNGFTDDGGDSGFDPDRTGGDD